MSTYNSQIARFRAAKNAYIPINPHSNRNVQNISIKNDYNLRERQSTPKQTNYQKELRQRQRQIHIPNSSNIVLNSTSYSASNPGSGMININLSTFKNATLVNGNNSANDGQNRSFMQFRSYQSGQYYNSNSNNINSGNSSEIGEKMRSTRGSTNGISSDGSYVKDNQKRQIKTTRQMRDQREIHQGAQKEKIEGSTKKYQKEKSESKYISLGLGTATNSASSYRRQKQKQRQQQRQAPQNVQSYTQRNFQHPSSSFSSSNSTVLRSRGVQSPYIQVRRQSRQSKPVQLNNQKYISLAGNSSTMNKGYNYIQSTSSRNSQRDSKDTVFIKNQSRQKMEQQQAYPLKSEKERQKQKEKEKYSYQVLGTISSKAHFQCICPVGKGGFGKVWKVALKRNKQIYAMKEMYKAKIIQKKSINSVMNERTLLAGLRHSFLINMNFAFQDRQNLYLIMDYVNGGDLRYQLGKYRRFAQTQAKFFMANIIVGLQYLHLNRIIHRDIKPQNLVFGSDGYLHITDLGISRQLRQNNYQDTSGTPGYMSPQVICRKNHSFQADFFALGVIGYQLMLGKRPYNGKNRKQIRQVILAKQAGIKLDQIPKNWSAQAADFINRLLIRTPAHRLGANGIQELKTHAWMKNVNWSKLSLKQIAPPYIPLSIQDDYQEYRKQISQDTVPDNYEQNLLMLRDSQVQNLFEGYNYSGKSQQNLKN